MNGSLALRLAIIATSVAILVSLGGTLVTLIDGLSSRSPNHSAVRVPTSSTTDAKLAQMSRKVDTLVADLKRLSTPSPADRLGAAVAKTSKQVEGIRSEVEEIRSAILADPAKAVRFALLQRDLANEREQSAAAVANVQSDVDREYDLMKWIIGTLVIGVAGMVLTVVVPALRTNDPPAAAGT